MGGAEHTIDHFMRDREHGPFERSPSWLTAVAAVVTTAAVYLEHYKVSFGDKWMRSPGANRCRMPTERLPSRNRRFGAPRSER
jgi:hypothetical protein